MWALLILILIPGVEQEHLLREGFASEVSCEVEKKRIWEEMRKAYPRDTDYAIVCRLQAKQL